MHSLTQLKQITSGILIALSLVCFGPTVTQAFSPPQDGGYPAATRQKGRRPFFSLATGMNNAAVGFSSLRSNTIGSFNTAIAAGALLSSTGDQNTATGT